MFQKTQSETQPPTAVLAVLEARIAALSVRHKVGALHVLRFRALLALVTMHLHH